MTLVLSFAMLTSLFTTGQVDDLGGNSFGQFFEFSFADMRNKNFQIGAFYCKDGEPVTQGLVLAEKLRPARRNGQPVLSWNGKMIIGCH
jgi:hypothetical protein